MGSPLAPVGAAPLFVSSNEALQDKGHGQTHPARSRRESDRGASRDASAAQSSDFAPGNTGPDVGFYQVAASLVLQYQLYNLGATDAAAANPAGAQAGADQPAPGADAGANTVAGSDAGALTATGAGAGFETTTASPSTPATSATSGNNNTFAVTGGTGTTAASSSSSTLKQEEARLQQALQALGLNPPAAIQAFMHAAQLLAEIAPGMFQEFVSYVTQLAKAAEPAVAASPALGAAAGATGITGPAPAAGSSSNAGTSQIQFEVGSIQVTQAEVSITPNQNGGQTLSVAAQSETVSFAELGSPAAQASTSSAAQNASAKNT
ncbi:MAG: hypothetical protein ACRD2P_09070 [Terriglobia bacterium]